MDDITRKTQDNRSNLYAFRRLKWGGADKRFRLLANPPREAFWRRPVPIPVASASPVTTVMSPSTEPSEPVSAPVIPLQRSRQTWPWIELFLIVVIAVSCGMIAAHLLR